MGKDIRIIEGWTRDLELPNIPDDAEIYNAARPFPAHQNWQGPFIHGIFYGVIYADMPYASEYRRRAKELDASQLVFITRATVEAWGHRYCEKHGVNYNDFTFDDIVRSYLNHSDD